MKRFALWNLQEHSSRGKSKCKDPEKERGWYVRGGAKGQSAWSPWGKRKEGEHSSDRERGPGCGNPPGHSLWVRRKRRQCTVNRGVMTRHDVIGHWAGWVQLLYRDEMCVWGWGARANVRRQWRATIQVNGNGGCDQGGKERWWEVIRL